MIDEPIEAGKRARMAETIRQVLARRERAPRSPQTGRAVKRLIGRYTHTINAEGAPAVVSGDPREGSEYDA